MLWFFLVMACVLCIATIVILRNNTWIMPFAISPEHFEQVSAVLMSALTMPVTEAFEGLFGYTPSARQVALILREVDARAVPLDQLQAHLKDTADMYEYRGNDALALVATRDLADWVLEPRNPQLSSAAVASVNRYVVDQVRSKPLRAIIDKVRLDLREHWGDFTQLMRNHQGNLLRAEALDLNVRDYMKDPCDMIQCVDEQLFLRMLPLEMHEILKCRADTPCKVQQGGTPAETQEAFVSQPPAPEPTEIADVIEKIKQAGGDRTVNIFVTNPTVYLNSGPASASVKTGNGAAASAGIPSGTAGSVQQGDQCNFGLGFHGLEELLMAPKEGALAYNKCVDGASLGDLRRERDKDVLDIMCARGNLFASADADTFGQLTPDQRLQLPEPSSRACVTTSPCVPQPRIEQSALVGTLLQESP